METDILKVHLISFYIMYFKTTHELFLTYKYRFKKVGTFYRN